MVQDLCKDPNIFSLLGLVLTMQDFYLLPPSEGYSSSASSLVTTLILKICCEGEFDDTLLPCRSWFLQLSYHLRKNSALCKELHQVS